MVGALGFWGFVWGLAVFGGGVLSRSLDSVKGVTCCLFRGSLFGIRAKAFFFF